MADEKKNYEVELFPAGTVRAKLKKIGSYIGTVKSKESKRFGKPYHSWILNFECTSPDYAVGKKLSGIFIFGGKSPRESNTDVMPEVFEITGIKTNNPLYNYVVALTNKQWKEGDIIKNTDIIDRSVDLLLDQVDDDYNVGKRKNVVAAMHPIASKDIKKEISNSVSTQKKAIPDEVKRIQGKFEKKSQTPSVAQDLEEVIPF